MIYIGVEQNKLKFFSSRLHSHYFFGHLLSIFPVLSEIHQMSWSESLIFIPFCFPSCLLVLPSRILSQYYPPIFHCIFMSAEIFILKVLFYSWVFLFLKTPNSCFCGLINIFLLMECVLLDSLIFFFIILLVLSDFPGRDFVQESSDP